MTTSLERRTAMAAAPTATTLTSLTTTVPTTTVPTTTVPPTPSTPGLTIRTVAPGVWRVTGEYGAVLGHIRCLPTEHGDRFQALRLSMHGLRTLDLGVFWNHADAVDCFR